MNNIRTICICQMIELKRDPTGEERRIRAKLQKPKKQSSREEATIDLHKRNDDLQAENIRCRTIIAEVTTRCYLHCTIITMVTCIISKPNRPKYNHFQMRTTALSTIVNGILLFSIRFRKVILLHKLCDWNSSNLHTDRILC